MSEQSELEKWALELDPDYPQDGTGQAMRIQTHRELMRGRSIYGALNLLKIAEEWCAIPFNYPGCGNRGEEHLAETLLAYLRDYCGKGRGE